MKRILFVIILLFMTVSTSNCTQNEVSDEISADVPTISEDEACAKVYDYLKTKVDDCKPTMRMYMQRILDEARGSFKATYVSKGHWSIAALGTEGAGCDYISGNWSVYESSGVVEPRNEQARKLLQLFQIYKE